MPPINLTELANDYDECRQIDTTESERLFNIICEHGQISGRILEIGCGTGFYLIPLAQRFPESEVHGFDLSDAMLQQARRKQKEARLQNCLLSKADGQNLPYRDNAFNFVLMSQVLHFFEDKPDAAREIRRVSKSGARLLVITSSHRQLRSQVDLGMFPGIIERETTRIPSLSDIRKLFEREDFDLLATVEFAVTYKATSADDLAEWASNKPWSSYQLIPETEFATSTEGFRRSLKETFGNGSITYLFPQTLLFFQNK